MFAVTKHYPHSLGLSTCFMQPGALSHCRYPHGYALAFTFEFWARDLDANNWVIDFGKLKPLKEWLVQTFDHKMIIAENDPEYDAWHRLAARDRVDLIVRSSVGMESFALWAHETCTTMLGDMGEFPRVQLHKVTVAEHEGNSASYFEPCDF